LFAAHGAYQLIDLALAVVLAAPCLALARGRFGKSVARRWPRLLATPARREMVVGIALFVALMSVAVVVGHTVVVPVVDRLLQGHPAWQRAINVSSFAVLGVAWLGGTLVLPYGALRAAWREGAATAKERARRRRDRWLAGAFAFGMAALLAYACFVEPNRIVVERARVELAHRPAGAPPLRVVLFSDLQSAYLGARERSVPERIAALEPDLIVIAGDLVAQSFDEATALEQARWVLTRLSAPLGVFVVNGDVDAVVAGGIEEIVRGTPARLLDNESVVLPCQPPIELLGIDPHQLARMGKLLAAPPRAALRIGLVHRPRHWEQLAAAGCELVLAGHTHGGQVVIPGFGPPITLETVPRNVAAGGLHRMDASTQLYVTRGIGREGGFAPQIRLFCPPEITLLELTGAAVEPN
jgi:predicted MPP superfamily phosphohydrolase